MSNRLLVGSLCNADCAHTRVSEGSAMRLNLKVCVSKVTFAKWWLFVWVASVVWEALLEDVALSEAAVLASGS